MDAIVHAPDQCILCIGTFKDQVPFSNTYIWNIFYQSTKEFKLDYLPLYDYLFRYDTECHWISRNYQMENKVLRTLFGPFVLGSSNLLSFAEKLPWLAKKTDQPDVIVDAFIPASYVNMFFSWYLEIFNYFPSG